MAIYGFGSAWSEGELKDDFFNEEKIVIGWDQKNAADLYSLLSSLKVGDIVYLKSNRPGDRTIRVKGIGIVTKNMIGCITSEEYGSSNISDRNKFVNVKWIEKNEFLIEIPANEGRLTNIRAATAYEEYLPFVQTEIINRISK